MFNGMPQGRVSSEQQRYDFFCHDHQCQAADRHQRKDATASAPDGYVWRRGPWKAPSTIPARPGSAPRPWPAGPVWPAARGGPAVRRRGCPLPAPAASSGSSVIVTEAELQKRLLVFPQNRECSTSGMVTARTALSLTLTRLVTAWVMLAKASAAVPKYCTSCQNHSTSAAAMPPMPLRRCLPCGPASGGRRAGFGQRKGIA